YSCVPRSSCRRRPLRACRSASWMTALKVLPSALARASSSRASSAGNVMVFLTTRATSVSADGSRNHTAHAACTDSPTGRYTTKGGECTFTSTTGVVAYGLRKSVRNAGFPKWELWSTVSIMRYRRSADEDCRPGTARAVLREARGRARLDRALARGCRARRLDQAGRYPSQYACA